MADFTAEIQALQKMAAALMQRMEADAKKPKPAPKQVAPPKKRSNGKRQPPRRSREELDELIRTSLATTLPGAVVRVYNGQTVVETDGQRFKLLIQGPFERIRATTGSGVRK